MWGYGLPFSPRLSRKSLLERSAIEGDSPVFEDKQDVAVSGIPFLGNGMGTWEALTSNRKYVPRPIADKYREGKLKRTLDRELKDLKSSSDSELGLLGVLTFVLNNVPGSVSKWQG